MPLLNITPRLPLAMAGYAWLVMVFMMTPITAQLFGFTGKPRPNCLMICGCGRWCMTIPANF